VLCGGKVKLSVSSHVLPQLEMENAFVR
jgi:hypothetical protein